MYQHFHAWWLNEIECGISNPLKRVPISADGIALNSMVKGFVVCDQCKLV